MQTIIWQTTSSDAKLGKNHTHVNDRLRNDISGQKHISYMEERAHSALNRLSLKDISINIRSIMEHSDVAWAFDNYTQLDKPRCNVMRSVQWSEQYDMVNAWCGLANLAICLL